MRRIRPFALLCAQSVIAQAPRALDAGVGGGGYQEHSPLPDSQIYPGTGAYGIRLVRDRGELARAGVLEIDKFNAVQIQRIGAGSRLLAMFLMRDCFNAKQKSIFMRT